VGSALENLATATGPLRAEPADAAEFEGLKQRGTSRLHDASNPSLGCHLTTNPRAVSLEATE